MSYQIAAETMAAQLAAPSRCEGKEDPGRGHKVAAILDVIGREIGRDLVAARAATYQLLQLLTPGAHAGSPPARGGLTPWQRRKIERYLTEHLEFQIRVEALAAEVALSAGHFCRAFKETFGETPHAHVMRLRFEMAQRMMLTTYDPLSQIALACGLADQAHLSKLFRRHAGDSPGRWRRRHSRGPAAASPGLSGTGSSRGLERRPDLHVLHR